MDDAYPLLGEVVLDPAMTLDAALDGSDLPGLVMEPALADRLLLSPGDTVRLVDAALRAPSPGFAVVWGVSANTRNWWDLTAARALGYEPADDAESYAEALIAVHGEPDLTDPVHSRVGGEFATAAFDSENFDA